MYQIPPSPPFSISLMYHLYHVPSVPHFINKCLENRNKSIIFASQKNTS